MPEIQLLGPELTHLLRRAERRAVQVLGRARHRLRASDVTQAAVSLRSTCGYTLVGQLWLPANPPAVLPALVWVGDGEGGRTAAADPAAPLSAMDAARLGYAVLAVDLAGRGESSGEDDHGGLEHADNVECAAIWLAEQPYVDPQRIGLVGLGLGAPVCVAAAAGGAPVAWVLDWEGPVDRETLISVCPDAELGVDDATWWRDRDTLAQLRTLPCGYVRLQSEDDHLNPEELRHAQRAMFAVHQGGGGGWYQINDHPRGEAPSRPLWLPPGRFAARRAIRRKLQRLHGERRPSAESSAAR